MSDKKCPNCGYQLDSWNDCVSVNNILECPECEEHFKLKAVTLNKPQLTIPKSIADELDGFNPDIGETKIAVLIEGYNECFISDELMQFCLVDNNLNLCALYLAGKALGVDLVKVGAYE